MLDEIKATLRLSFPIVASLLAQMAMEFVDVVMMGRLGANELAAGGLATSVYTTVYIFIMGNVLSVGVFVSRGVGAKDYHEVIASIKAGLIIALFFGLIGAIIIYFTEDFLLLIKQQSLVSHLAGDYAGTVLWGIPASLGFLALREYVTSLSMPKVVMFIAVMAIPMDGALNYILMYGKFGFPAMGVGGIGLATSITGYVIFIALIIYTILHPKLRVYPYWRKPFVIPWKNVIEMIKVGIPIGATLLFEVGLFATASILMGYFGVASLAAHQIAIQCVSIAFMIPMGIAQVTTIRIGHAVGLNEAWRIKPIFWASATIVFTFNCASAAIFWFFPEQLADLYLDTTGGKHQAIVAKAVLFFHAAAVFQWVDSAQAITNGALRGLKDTFVPMVLALVAYWGLGLASSVFLAFYTPLKGTGLWWGLVIGLSFAAVLLLTRFYWKINR